MSEKNSVKILKKFYQILEKFLEQTASANFDQGGASIHRINKLSMYSEAIFRGTALGFTVQAPCGHARGPKTKTTTKNYTF